MASYMRLFSLSLILVAVFFHLSLLVPVSAGKSTTYDRVRLSDVETITATEGKMTTGRRSSPVPQLKCVKGDCSYAPSTMMCKNIGSDGVDVSWKCEAPNLPKGVELSNVEVVCEGFDYPDDPYILRGSCGVEYGIKASPLAKDETLRERERVEQHKYAHAHPESTTPRSSPYAQPYGSTSTSPWWLKYTPFGSSLLNWLPWGALGWHAGSSWWGNSQPQPPQRNSWWNWWSDNNNNHHQQSNSWWGGSNTHAHAHPHASTYGNKYSDPYHNEGSFFGNLITLGAIFIIVYVVYRACVSSASNPAHVRRDYNASPPPYPGSAAPHATYPPSASDSPSSYSNKQSSAPIPPSTSSSSTSGFWQGMGAGALASYLWHRATTPSMTYQQRPSMWGSLFGGQSYNSAPPAGYMYQDQPSWSTGQSRSGWFGNSGYNTPAHATNTRTQVHTSPTISPAHSVSPTSTHTSTAFGGTRRR